MIGGGQYGRDLPRSDSRKRLTAGLEIMGQDG